MDPTETNQPPSTRFYAAHHQRITTIVKDEPLPLCCAGFLSRLPACGATLQQTIDLGRHNTRLDVRASAGIQPPCVSHSGRFTRLKPYPRRHFERYSQFYIDSHGRRAALASITTKRHRQSIPRTIRAATLSQTILFTATGIQTQETSQPPAGTKATATQEIELASRRAQRRSARYSSQPRQTWSLPREESTHPLLRWHRQQVPRIRRR